LYNLGELYARINEFELALEYSNLTLELAKEQKFYDIIANTYLNLSDIYLFMDDEETSREFIEDARTYFSKEEQRCKDSGKYNNLSQIYQILKTINAEINDKKEFVKFSRKEAKSYIDLAKHIHREKLNYYKLANFYKGAAVCFKETDYLECATCYYLAARIFQQIGEYTLSNSCYSEAAELFEEIGLYKRAIELYCQSAENYLQNNNLEFAIEKFMNAFDLLSRENINFQKYELAEKIETNLIRLSTINANENRYFIAGTLLLETLFYYKKAGLRKSQEDINKLLNKIQFYYQKEYQEHAESGKSSWVAYMLALTAIAHISLGKMDKAYEYIKKLKLIENGSNTINSYRKITELILKSKKEEIKFTLSTLDKKSKKIYSGLEEVKLFNNLLFY
jgi:tetratricopeptide (TPR) repeat protein